MTQKIAVAVIHGIGNQSADFIDKVIEHIVRWCSPEAAADLVIRLVHWAPVLQATEVELMLRLAAGGPLRFHNTRGFMVNFVADAVAYQMTPNDRELYDAIHGVFAATLRELAAEAGATAPLCIIGHSLGTIIASNYLYDLQHAHLLPDTVRAQMVDTPLERGETLTMFYTLGSPLALWSLRYRNFGKPIQFPPPQLATHHPGLLAEWINFYDPDDVIAAPIKHLNDHYTRVVTEDRAVNIGSVIQQWNPLSHIGYLSDKDVVRPIADQFATIWALLNQAEG